MDCPARLELRLRHGSPRLDVRLEFENRADDHRLRALFPTPHATDALVSEGHYLVHERPLLREDRPDWTQPPPATWPQQGFSCLQDGAGGLAVLNRGLPEVEGLRADAGAGLALTLLRCVEWLSRDDLSTRPGNAGPTLRTPEAQCRGAHVFELALLPYRGDWLSADVPGESRRWRSAPRSLQGVEAGRRAGGSLLRRVTTRTAVTAIKRCEERDTLIVRLVNLASEPVEERLELGFAAREAHRTNLLEERRRALPLSDNALVVSLRPHEIATLEIVPG